jgi:predicted nucleotidyltransferase
MLSKSEIMAFLEQNKEYFFAHFHVEQIGVFGSFARDEQTEESDIDILVQFRVNTPNLFEMRMELKDYLQSNLGRNVDICHQKAIKPVFRDMILADAIYV